jgi:hypothetical protein
MNLIRLADLSNIEILPTTISPKREREMATLMRCSFETKPSLRFLFARTVESTT